MNRALLKLLLGVVLMGLAACGGGGGGGDTDAAPTNFTAFVKDLLSATAEDTEPVEINDLEFSFDEDPGAFDGVL